MRKIILSLLIGAAALVSARAQSLQFLNIPADARTAALANASVALPAGTFAVESGMAATVLDSGTMAVGSSYGSWAPKTAKMGLVNVGGWYRFDKVSVGLAGRYCLEQPYDVFSDSAKPLGSFTPREFNVGVGVAFQVADPFSIGVTARFVSSAIADKASGTAVGADISAMYAADGFRAALGVCNLGTKISYGKADYAQPAYARLGGAYSAAGFTAGAEVDYLFAGALMAGLGLEYCIEDIVSLRGGFHYGDAAKAIPTYASLGLGVKYAGVHLDFAFLTASKTIGNSLLLTLGYAF